MLIIGLCAALVLGGCASGSSTDASTIGSADETTHIVITATEATEAESTQAAESESSEAAADETTEQAETTGFSVTYRGTVIALDADMEPIIEALGEPKSYTEETSCAFDGLDKTYYYGSLYIQTYPSEDGDRVNTVWFADDGVTTDEGVCIGSTKEAVEAAYGAEYFTNDTTCQLNRDGQRLLILLKDGAVSSIQYSIITT